VTADLARLTEAEGRAFAESLMTDACTIQTVLGETLDEDTLQLIPTLEPLYSGKCLVSGGSTSQSAAGIGRYGAGERAVITETRIVKVPAAVSGIKPDQLLTITACADPELVGRTFLIRGEESKTYLTSRRLTCEDITG
jgi:hypothetical protein